MRGEKRAASAVVTGAGSGIGRAFAIEIAKRGGRVVCSDIDLASAKTTVSQVEAAGGSGLAVMCDVAKLADVEALARDAEAWLGGPVDLVVNNAGVGVGGKPIGEISMEDWNWILGINLWGVIHGCHVFAPKLRALGRGGIINVASAAAFGAAPLMGAYNVTKAGVLALSETLAAELVGTGVNVSVLCPTFVQTNIVQASRGPEWVNESAQRLMNYTGIPTARVARTTLDAHARGQLYVLPQLDARMLWRLKRYSPARFTRGMGWMQKASRLVNRER